jgi:nucleolar complex protein 2
MITTAVSPTGRPKPSTLRPLDLHVHIRVPAQYLKTRVYLEGYCEEAVFLLAEWCESVQGSIAFPEVTVPLTVVLRKCVKKAGSNASGKVVATVKGLIERIEDGSKWVLARREGVKFAPGMMDEVDNWENDINLEETPFGKWLKVLRKAREKKRQLVEKVCPSDRSFITNISNRVLS